MDKKSFGGAESYFTNLMQLFSSISCIAIAISLISVAPESKNKFIKFLYLHSIDSCNEISGDSYDMYILKIVKLKILDGNYIVSSVDRSLCSR